jgi:flagellar FliL protein
LVLLIGDGCAGAWYFFFSDLPGSKNASGDGGAPKETVKTSAPQNLQTTTLDPFLVNLADPLGKRYIKATFEVEVTGPEVGEELTKQKPKVRDSIIMLLSSKIYMDLAPAESKLALKTEVANRLNQILGTPKVSRVFITEKVI